MDIHAPHAPDSHVQGLPDHARHDHGPDMELFRQQVLALGAGTTVQEQLGRRLAEFYRDALKD